MNIFFNTFYFCSFFFKWAGLRAGLRAGPGLILGPGPGPPINGLGPGFSPTGRAGPKAGRGPRAFWRPLAMCALQ